MIPARPGVAGRDGLCRVGPRVVDVMLSHLGSQGAHDSGQGLAQALDTS